jgi:hypothetical protein
MRVVLKQPSLENPAAGVVVETTDRPSADLLPGSVRVKLSLRPINPADIFSLMGTSIDIQWVVDGCSTDAWSTFGRYHGFGRLHSLPPLTTIHLSRQACILDLIHPLRMPFLGSRVSASSWRRRATRSRRVLRYVHLGSLKFGAQGGILGQLARSPIHNVITNLTTEFTIISVPRSSDVLSRPSKVDRGHGSQRWLRTRTTSL